MKKSFDDALHIATASVNNCNVILSWNFKHIVKLKTMIGVNCRWVAFIKDADNDQKKELIESIKDRSESIKMAAELLRKISEDEKEREKIIAIEKARIEQLSREADAKELGKEETALEMLKDGLSIEKINQYTKLPIETIKKLQK